MKVREGYEEIAAKLLDKSTFNPDTGCQHWGRGKFPDGYGSQFYEGRVHLAHRLAYRAFVGEIPYKLFVLHKCDNRACIHPDHLFVGDQFANMQDMADKKRGCHGEKSHRSKLTDEQVVDIRASTESNAKLATKYGVVPSLISEIRSGKRWKHLIEEAL